MTLKYGSTSAVERSQPDKLRVMISGLLTAPFSHGCTDYIATQGAISSERNPETS